MNNDALKSKLIRISQKHLGDWGGQFIERQCERLNIDINNLSSQNLEKLANEAANTAVIIIGRKRAEGLKMDIMALSKTAH